MKEINIIIFFIFFYLVNNQVPSGYVVNTCGNLGYNAPGSSSDCRQDGEICCFVHLTNTPKGEQKFCVSAPSKISINDVKEDIEEYTNFKLNELVCNNSKFINNIILISLLFLFILIL